MIFWFFKNDYATYSDLTKMAVVPLLWKIEGQDIDCPGMLHLEIFHGA